MVYIDTDNTLRQAAESEII